MKHEDEVLYYYLKYGLSTRQLDEKLQYDSVTSKGWKSHKILKKYNLVKEDKTKAFVCSNQEIKDIIKTIKNATNRKEIDDVLNNLNPKKIDKYKNSYVLTESEETLYQVMSGETRNSISVFFKPLRKLISQCEFDGCTKTKLETVHFKKTRPEIFKEASKKLAIKHKNNLNKYSIYDVMKLYIHMHSNKNAICFLCEGHHKKLDAFKNKDEKYKSYIKQINTNI